MSTKGARDWIRHPLVRVAVALLALGFIADRGADRAYSGNREAVIQIMRQLHKDMTKAEVERILSQHESHFFVRHPSPEGLVWWTKVGLVTAWSLGVTFSGDGRLNTARVSTEDGPYHPGGVPPDIR